MIRSRHFIGVGGVGLLLLVVVFVTMFGSTTIVSRLAALDAEHLARGWLTSLQSEFDLPGDPVPEKHTGFDRLVGFLLDEDQEDARTINVFNPADFGAQQHFGSISGYAIFTRFGQLTIAGGKPFVRALEHGAMSKAIDAVLESRMTRVVPLDFVETDGKAIVSVIVPLVRNNTVRGVVSVEIERHSFEIVMQKGVQAVASITALAMGVVGFFGIIVLYDWGRVARQAQREASFLAYTDPVTLLPNRRKFEEVLSEEVAKSIASGVEIAVAFSDVDNFKTVNDTYGHTAGDRMLVEIGNRLQAILRPGDYLFRVSGDHFAMILQTPEGAPVIAALCEQIQEMMTAPILPDEFGVKLSFSTGVARCLVDGNDAEQLMKAADLALYRAKSDGRRTFRFFKPEMNTEIADKVRLQHAFEEALAHDQLHLAYQPQVEAGTGKLLGFEALARWTHPTEGPISPTRFIAVAEQTGLIMQLGEWALQQACAEASLWPDDLSIAVNLSPAQLRDPRLLNLLKTTLQQTGLAPERLELEITESVMLQDTDLTQRTFKAIRALGVGLAMDDFGTGYSSLSYLTRIPLTKLKIDKSFISRYGCNKKDDAIVNTVIQLSLNLGLGVTAEGVETVEQAQWLTDAGCTSLQGYLYGKPTDDPQKTIAAGPLFLKNGSVRLTG